MGRSSLFRAGITAVALTAVGFQLLGLVPYLDQVGAANDPMTRLALAVRLAGMAES